MKSPIRIAPIVLSAWTALLLIAVIPPPPLQAQSSSTESRGDTRDGSSRDEGRGERRDSWRSRLRARESDRDRASRGGPDRDADGGDREEDSSGGTSATASAVPRASTPTKDSTTGIDARAWATSLVKQHDKNGNMILDPEEQSGLGSSAAASDLNKDGRITIDELLMRSSASGTTTVPATNDSAITKAESMAPRDGERSSSFGSRDRDRDSRESHSRTDLLGAASKRVFTGSAGGAQSGDAEKNKRRSYRFTPPADRLPKGLPSFFSRDANGDGQIAMHEYSRTWSSRTVAEFRRYDLNDDGIITPKEAAK